ncbi:MAG: SpoVA/SpoVAEb family sporulation membrane protein [Clostridia bacterium]
MKKKSNISGNSNEIIKNNSNNKTKRYKNKVNNKAADSVMKKGAAFTHINKQNYLEYVAAVSPKTAHFKNIIWAFLIGGAICTLGQVIIEVFVKFDWKRDEAAGFASCILVILAAFATGFGIYDKLGRFAGAGSTIPITGFSNAIVAPALEFRCEGMIYGIGAKMFLVAGPVIVNGVSVAIIIALIKWIVMGWIK